MKGKNVPIDNIFDGILNVVMHYKNKNKKTTFRTQVWSSFEHLVSLLESLSQLSKFSYLILTTHWKNPILGIRSLLLILPL